jgi:hypothetical protein
MRSQFILGITLSFSVSAFAADQTVSIPRSVPFAAESDVAGNIKRECAIDVKLSDFIAEYAAERRIPVSVVDKTDASMPGRVLVLEIVDAESSGNAFIGHHKSTKVRGSYFEDSKLVGSFKVRRDSMGGMFAGFKGSCSVLGRTVREIGKDIAEWMVHPVPDAELGDLK